MICAVSTAPARAAIAVVRASGGNDGALFDKIAPFIRARVSLPEMELRTAYYVNIVDTDAGEIDDVLLYKFAAPSSYTGEDSVEIHCHGNPLIVRTILALLYGVGIRAAEPGEFTRRAFMNGKLSIDAAEAVREIIEAKNFAHLSAAKKLKAGVFRTGMLALRSKLMNLLADLNAELDFIDEDITFASREAKLKILRDVRDSVTELHKSATLFDAFREGIHVAIVGAPNAGKSSLMNRLVGHERSIVSDIAGTTRDYIESELALGGYGVKLFDTAGLNANSQDTIETLGIGRTRDLMARAHILLHLLDGSAATASNEIVPNALVVVNKSDILHSDWQNAETRGTILISAKTGSGIDNLLEHLTERIVALTPQDALPLGAWQLAVLQSIASDMETTIEALETQEVPEVVTHVVQQAVERIATLTGTISSEDILGRIFSRFCIGK